MDQVHEGSPRTWGPRFVVSPYNVEKFKKFLELKFCEPGMCVFYNKLKMACAQNLEALIIF
jgi:hypothetical protein